MKIKSFFVFLILSTSTLNSQIKKFGDVRESDFEIQNDKPYKNDNAIVLFKKRMTYYKFTGGFGWTVITKVHERLLLRNSNAFDYATKKIKLYTEKGKEEKLTVKATTYNFINNKIIKTKLKKADIFRTKLNKYWFKKVFTMPNLKPGSIVEWEYVIRSPFPGHINDVIYKSEIPIMNLEAVVEIPSIFVYRYYPPAFFPVDVKISKGQMLLKADRLSAVGISESLKHNFTVNTIKYNLHLKNVSPLEKEPLMSYLFKTLGKLKFELAYIQYPNEKKEHYTTTWDDVAKTLLKKEEFGKELNQNFYLPDINNIVSVNDYELSKLQKILNFVKHKVKWNHKYGILTDQGVQKAFTNGSGNIAELNFILISLLRQAGLDANPVLAGTEIIGKPEYPTIEHFDYVLTGVKINNKNVLLDPALIFAPPGIISEDLLSSEGRLIKNDSTTLVTDLFPKDFSRSIKNISAKVTNDLSVQGFEKEVLTDYLALDFRNTFAGFDKNNIIKGLSDLYQADILNFRSSNLQKPARKLTTNIQFNMEDAIEEIGDKYVFNPALFLKMKENIFKAETRNFPVFFKYPFSKAYVIKIEIPQNFSIERIPENIIYNLPDKMGVYTYQIMKENNIITLKTELAIASTVIPTEQYNDLRNFYNKIMTKENEKVILTKK